MPRFLLSSLAILCFSCLAAAQTSELRTRSGEPGRGTRAHKPATTEQAPHRLDLAIRDGRVWLSADGVSLSEILLAYGRIGGTEIVHAEGLATEPVTIELAGVPERRALDLLLRPSGGFVVVPKPGASSDIGSVVSEFARILIVPGSAPAASSAGAAAVAASTPAADEATASATAVEVAPGVRRLIGPDGQPVADDQDVPVPENAPSQVPPSAVPEASPQQVPVPSPQSAPTAMPTSPIGVARPGMVPVSPQADPTTQPVRRPGSGPQG